MDGMMKNSLFPALFIILAFVLTTVSMLLDNEPLIYLSLLFLGLAAIIFQKFIHRKPIQDLGYKWPPAHGVIYS
jgi:hypothetical protein